MPGTATDSNPKAAPRTRRWRLPAALIALAAVAGLLTWQFGFRLPVGHGPAGPPVDAAAFHHVWTTQSVLLVGLGDSVTAGLGARKGYSYFDRLRANPPEEWPAMKGVCLASVLPHLRATNLAISGSTSLDHRRVELPRLPCADSNTLGLVVMTTGGNDLIHDYGRSAPREGAMYGASWAQAQPWIRNFDQRLETMIQEIGRHFPGGCHIFLANIYDPTDGVGDARRVGLPPWPDALRIHAAYNEIIERTAQRHANVHRVDLQTPFLGHGLFCTQFWRSSYDRDDPHYWFFVNVEDPNERGYDAIRRLFLIELARVFGSGIQPPPRTHAP